MGFPQDERNLRGPNRLLDELEPEIAAELEAERAALAKRVEQGEPMTGDETFAQTLKIPAFDQNKRWFDEYMTMMRRANGIAIENAHLAQRIYELEHQLVSLALTEADIGNIGSAELQRICEEHLRLVRAIAEELRARHVPLPEGWRD